MSKTIYLVWQHLNANYEIVSAVQAYYSKKGAKSAIKKYKAKNPECMDDFVIQEDKIGVAFGRNGKQVY